METTLIVLLAATTVTLFVQLALAFRATRSPARTIAPAADASDEPPGRPEPVTPPRSSAILMILAASIAVAGCKKDAAPSSSTTSAVAPEEGGTIKVMVDDKGFSPSSVRATKGKPLKLQFIRNSEASCAKRVVVPELNVSADLPLGTPVDVTIPSDEPRTLTFQCGLAMFKGSVVVN